MISILAASFLASFAFASPLPAPQIPPAGDPFWSTLSYGVDWKTVDYSNVDYSTIDWTKINYAAAFPTATASPASPTATATATASSATATSTAAPVSNGFSLISIRSGDVNVHLQAIYAKGSKLQLGGSSRPSSYTPPNISGVPTVNYTTYQVSDTTGRMALRVVVPGGQAVYVAADGVVSYTVPHSGGAAATDSPATFSLSATNVLQVNGARTFAACPNGDNSYTVYDLSKSTRTDCTGIDLRATADSSAPGWEW